MPSNIVVRTMREADLDEARQIFRVAFGTFIGLPNPADFAADREYIFTRWRANPQAALAVEVDGQLAGSNFLVRWGSFGYFGPLTVRPALWNQHLGQRLLEPTMEMFAQWGVPATGLFTFPHSTKHLGLYQKFGYWPRFLTPVMSRAVSTGKTAGILVSSLHAEQRKQAIQACRELTDSIYAGLDVTSEIEAVHAQKLGETVLVWGGDTLEAFAVCHFGGQSEAGKGNCYLKFAAARPGNKSPDSFARLLDACEALAAAQGLERVTAGVNTARIKAYQQMLAGGFRTEFQGVAMHRPDTPIYGLPDNFVIDDWR